MNKKFKPLISSLIFAVIILVNLIPACISAEVTEPSTNITESIEEISPDNTEQKNIQIPDNRKFTRFKNTELKMPVLTENSDNRYKSIIDISRGGLALGHNNSIATGDIIPVKLIYKDIIINTEVKIISATETRAGGEFVNLNKTEINQLLYLSIMIEADNNILPTKLSKPVI